MLQHDYAPLENIPGPRRQRGTLYKQAILLPQLKDSEVLYPTASDGTSLAIWCLDNKVKKTTAMGLSLGVKSAEARQTLIGPNLLPLGRGNQGNTRSIVGLNTLHCGTTRTLLGLSFLPWGVKIRSTRHRKRGDQASQVLTPEKTARTVFILL